MHRFVIFLALLGLWGSTASGQTRLLPVDEAAKDPAFFVFRSQLQNAVARHDAKTVLSMMNPEIQMGFGSEQGMKDFIAKWKPNEPNSKLWDTLSTILSLGGRFNPDGSFTAPYVSTQWSPKYGAQNHAAVVGQNIPVRAAPQATAEQLAVLNFHLVELVNAQQAKVPQEWQAIRMKNGKTGYVQSRHVRSPMDYRLSMAYFQGRWQILSMMSGD